jgi:prepilin-type N-terminal cleavage/methylation domain-containing protein
MGPRRVLTVHIQRGMRRGMTLIETMIAVVILGTALIGLGDFMAHFAHATKVAALQQRGLDLATDRVDSAEHAPTYVSLDTMAATENITIDSTVYTRQTIVQHIGGGPTDTLDYRTVTVQVTLPTVTNPVRKTVIIAAF